MIELVDEHLLVLFVALALHDIARRAKPLDDLAPLVKNGQRARKDPTDAAVDAQHPVLELEYAFAGDGVSDGGKPPRLIDRVEIKRQSWRGQPPPASRRAAARSQRRAHWQPRLRA